MKNRLLQLAAGLALMVVLGKFYAVPLMAQVRAALVKNIDERGRNPYSLSADCDQRGSCYVPFGIVPANRRFVVEYVGGQIDVPHAGEFSSAYVFVPEIQSGSSPTIVTHFDSTNPLNFDHYSVSMPVLFYLEAGQTPALVVNENNPDVRDSIFATIRLWGYLVDLTQ